MTDDIQGTGPRGIRRFLGAPFLSLSSQAIGLLQLAALLWRYGPSNATDAYLYLFNLGNLPTQILIVGVLYPMLLSEDRITRQRAIQFGRYVPISGFLAVVAGAGWLYLTGRLSVDLIFIIALAAINAVVQARLWFFAVIAAAGGIAHWIAAIALPANFLALIALLFPWNSSAETVTAMMLALTVANVVFLLVTLRSQVGVRVIMGLPLEPTRKHRAYWWFLAKSGTSYGGLMIVQSLALILPASTLTLLTLPMKIVGSVSATFVNAIMPLLVHQETDSPVAARRFLRLLATLLSVVGLVFFAGASIFFVKYQTETLVVALWLVASASASVAGRMAYRFLKPSASRVTLIVVPIVVLGVASSTASSSFGLVSLLCAYALADAASAFLFLLALRDRPMGIVSGLITVALVFIWVRSLIP